MEIKCGTDFLPRVCGRFTLFAAVHLSQPAKAPEIHFATEILPEDAGTDCGPDCPSVRTELPRATRAVPLLFLLH